jgi:GntR family transcriptional repressor for pyruvate dehydrogenase complex
MRAKTKGQSRTHLFAAIVDHLEEMMARGRIPPGDRLPAERHLAAVLKVSRSSVREAIRVLEQKGLLEIRRGRKGGAYVKTPAPPSLQRLDRLTLDQITEFRLTIEGDVTAMATQAADSTDIRRLNRRLETARTWMARGSRCVDAYIEADKALHLCVAQIAGNPLFTQALDAALVLQPHFCHLLKQNPALMETNHTDLMNIVRAIETGRSEAASCACMTHITRFDAAVR